MAKRGRPATRITVTDDQLAELIAESLPGKDLPMSGFAP